jgi:hypothetical protein
MQRKVFIPEGLTVNHPFFYIIQHTPSGKYYAGYCSKQSHCNSTKFMTEMGYQTSSKGVKTIILNETISSFSIIRIRHFSYPNEAMVYERLFLLKVKARSNPIFINKSNGAKDFRHDGCNHTEETKRKISLSLTGRSLSKITREKMKQANLGKIVSDETKMKMKKSQQNRKPISDETRHKLSMAKKGKPLTEEHRKKMSESQLRRYSNN